MNLSGYYVNSKQGIITSSDFKAKYLDYTFPVACALKTKRTKQKYYKILSFFQ